MATGREPVAEHARLVGLSFALFLGALPCAPLFAVCFSVSVAVTAPFAVFMLPCCLLLPLPWTRRAGKAAIRALAFVPSPIVVALTGAVRWYADLHRRAASRLTGAEIPSPYLTQRKPGLPRRFGTIVRDAATWRDLTWLLVNTTAGIVFCVLTWALFLGSAWYLVLPMLDRVVPVKLDVVPELVAHAVNLQPSAAPLVSLGIGVLGFVLFWQVGPLLMRVWGVLTKSLLGPTQRARLALRVEQLAESRAETVDSQAAEIRRIERDLHDGAQARLVALGMNLGMAEEMMARDPDAARELLAEARQSSNKALAELRDLVRGIHPPVLADRGLEGAVRAVALDSPLHVELDIDLPGRPTAPVESAAYFATVEALTNAAKHSGSRSVKVHIRYAEGMLRVTVTDHGVGGAAVGSGGGLHGVQRRLSAFDGTLTLISPSGGPTVIEMEVPCALSSAKT